MILGILETGKLTPDLEQKYGTYPEMFVRLLGNRGLDLDFSFYPVVDGIFPESVDACDAWLITGSRHGAYEDLPWIARLEEFIREIASRKMPLIGICFGHQIIAQALGGKVVKSEKGWGIGINDYQIIQPAPWMNGSTQQSISVHALHQDQVVEVPEGASVIAGSQFCPHAMLSYGDSIYTIQPHPEFENEFHSDLINTRRGIVFDNDLADRGLSRIGQPIQSGDVANWIVSFLSQHA